MFSKMNRIIRFSLLGIVGFGINGAILGYIHTTDDYIQSFLDLNEESHIIEKLKALFNGQAIALCAATDRENLPFTLELEELEE